MVWHMRGDGDPAQRWFRDRVREAAMETKALRPAGQAGRTRNPRKPKT